jgi:hypothetical protein
LSCTMPRAIRMSTAESYTAALCSASPAASIENGPTPASLLPPPPSRAPPQFSGHVVDDRRRSPATVAVRLDRTADAEGAHLPHEAVSALDEWPHPSKPNPLMTKLMLGSADSEATLAVDGGVRDVDSARLAAACTRMYTHAHTCTRMHTHALHCSVIESTAPLGRIERARALRPVCFMYRYHCRPCTSAHSGCRTQWCSRQCGTARGLVWPREGGDLQCSAVPFIVRTGRSRSGSARGGAARW